MKAAAVAVAQAAVIQTVAPVHQVPRKIPVNHVAIARKNVQINEAQKVIEALNQKVVRPVLRHHQQLNQSIPNAIKNENQINIQITIERNQFKSLTLRQSNKMH